MKPRAILAIFALCSAGINSTLACCALGRAGEPVVNADQTVLLIWDPKTKTEHFIRKASFKAEGDDFGFLVPTPSRPQLSESGNEVFPQLAEITRPRSKPSLSIGCSVAPHAYPNLQAGVTVIERKEVAGFDAAVLTASSPGALTGWLKTNGYHFSPEVEAWAAPYVRDGWMLTALRVAKRSKSQTIPPSRPAPSGSPSKRSARCFPTASRTAARPQGRSASHPACCGSISSATRATPEPWMEWVPGPARPCGAMSCRLRKRKRCSVC